MEKPDTSGRGPGHGLGLGLGRGRGHENENDSMERVATSVCAALWASRGKRPVTMGVRAGPTAV